jgi:hypothetical protein
MPHWEGEEACRLWLLERRKSGRGAGVPRRPHRRGKNRATMADSAEHAEPDTAVAVAESPPPAEGEIDLDRIYNRLPSKLRKMPPKEAYEWLRTIKLANALDTEASDRISRAQAMQLLVERAQHLRSSLMAIPRRVRHLIDDAAFAALTVEIRKALQVYAAPEGYLDRLLPEEPVAEPPA